MQIKSQYFKIDLNRLTAKTLSQLQKRTGPMDISQAPPKTQQSPPKMLRMNTDTDSLMDMIKRLQDEIKVGNNFVYRLWVTL